MSFMDKVIKNSLDLWEAAANESFVENMGKNILDKDQFYDYIIQDSLYLRDYIKAYAMGIFKSSSLKEMQIFYSALGFANDSENCTRLKYLEDINMTDDDVEKFQKKPACENYTRFLLETAENEDIPEILMAVMPCMLGYFYVFNKLINKYPSVRETYFAPLVSDYTSEQYKNCCEYWTDYCNTVCSDLNSERKQKLTDIFREASRHELYFWQMAGNK